MEIGLILTCITSFAFVLACIFIYVCGTEKEEIANKKEIKQTKRELEETKRELEETKRELEKIKEKN